jgi:hypothetical protein
VGHYAGGHEQGLQQATGVQVAKQRDVLDAWLLLRIGGMAEEAGQRLAA